MHECNETVTVFNRHLDKVTGYDVWSGTILVGVSVHINMEAEVNEHGLTSADKATIRIPDDVICDKTYVDYKTYDKATSVTNLYTLREGDVIAKASVGTDMNPDQLKDTYPDVYTVLSVTDNLSRPHGKHIKVVCR